MRIGQVEEREAAAMAELANDIADKPRRRQRRARGAQRLASALARCASRGRPGGVIASSMAGARRVAMAGRTHDRKNLAPALEFKEHGIFRNPEYSQVVKKPADNWVLARSKAQGWLVQQAVQA